VKSTTGRGANAYRSVALDSALPNANPIELVLMLYDGALAAIRLAAGHMKAGRIADKGAALSKAISIVDNGLKASLDHNVGGEIAGQLHSLYEYMTMRLLQANLRNDERALDEVLRLLADLRSAWAQIGAQGAGANLTPAATNAPASKPAASGTASAAITAQPLAPAAVRPQGKSTTGLYQDNRQEALPRLTASA